METIKTVAAIFAICTNFYQSCLGCGEIIEYKEHRASIQSPNFGAEYGKAANCSWQFNSINSRYALQLKLVSMRMFYYDVNGDKQCGDSYRLIINGEQEDCTLDIVKGSRAKYYYFYSNPSCANMDCSFDCDNKIKIDYSTIRVKYIADGSKPINRGPGEMWGFEIKYEYVECPRDTETVGTSSRVTSASPTSVQKPTSANPASETTTTTPAATTTITTTTTPATTTTTTTTPATTTTTTTTPATTTTTTTTPATSITTTTTTTKKPTTTSAPPTARPSIQPISISATSLTTSPPHRPKSNNHLSPVTVSSTSSRVESDSGMPINNQEDSKPNNPLLYGLIGGGIALFILIVIIICIVRKRNRKNKTGKSGSGDDESGHCMTENALYVTSEDLADDVGHTSVDPAVVYTAVDKSAKTQKTDGPQYAEDSQSDDAGHASMDTPVLYAVVDKSSKSSETEAPTYAQVDISAKLIDQDNNQSEPASDATPTNKPSVYATVEINDSGTKRTVH